GVVVGLDAGESTAEDVWAAWEGIGAPSSGLLPHAQIGALLQLPERPPGRGGASATDAIERLAQLQRQDELGDEFADGLRPLDVRERRRSVQDLSRSAQVRRDREWRCTDTSTHSSPPVRRDRRRVFFGGMTRRSRISPPNTRWNCSSFLGVSANASSTPSRASAHFHVLGWVFLVLLIVKTGMPARGVCPPISRTVQLSRGPARPRCIAVPSCERRAPSYLRQGMGPRPATRAWSSR